MGCSVALDGTYWLHTDRLGSIQAITNIDGCEIKRRSYRAYGDLISEAGNHIESRGWIDQRTDAETSLTYLHARYYDPTVGTFISPDPLHPGEPGVGTARYTYGFGNPVAGTDRSGLRMLCARMFQGFSYANTSSFAGGPHQPVPDANGNIHINLNFLNECSWYDEVDRPLMQEERAAILDRRPGLPSLGDNAGNQDSAGSNMTEAGSVPLDEASKNKKKTDKGGGEESGHHDAEFRDPCTTSFGGRFLDSSTYLAHSAGGRALEGVHAAEIGLMGVSAVVAAALLSQAIRDGTYHPMILGFGGRTGRAVAAAGEVFHHGGPYVLAVAGGGIVGAAYDAGRSNNGCH